MNPDVMVHAIEAASDRTLIDVRECRKRGHAPVVVLLLVPPPYFLSGRVVSEQRASKEIDRLAAAFRDQRNARDDVFSAIFTEMIQPHAPPLPMLESALLWWVSQMNYDYERRIREGNVIVRVTARPAHGDRFCVGGDAWHKIGVVSLPPT